MSSSSQSVDMVAVCNGDRAAFHRVVVTYQQEILRYCLRFLGDQALAEDITQEVFLTLWRTRDGYVEQGKLQFYLLRMARLRCLAAGKGRRYRSTLLRLVRRETNTATEEPRYRDGTREWIGLGLKKLRPEQRDVVVLRFLEGYTISEISEVTGLKEGTVKSRLNRALMVLRKELSCER